MNQSELDYMNAQMRIQEFHREAERAQLLRLARRSAPKPPSRWKQAAAHLAGHLMASAGRRLTDAGERLHGQIHAHAHVHEPQPRSY